MTIHLDEQSSALLRSIADSEKRSETEVVQALLADYASRSPSHGSPPVRPQIRGIGKFGSGSSDTSARVDEILERAVKEGEWP